MASLDFGSAFAIGEIILAFVVILLMQCVARDPDFRSALGWLKWGHRVGFVIVAGALISNAGMTLDSGSDPRPIDVATIAALLAVLAISISRHGLAIRQARQARRAAERPPATLALFRVLIVAAAAGLAVLPAVADGSGPSAFDPPAATHEHVAGEDWIMRGGHRNAAGEWCCGEGDCFMIPAEQVTTTGDGYLLFGAERVPYTEAMPSPDGAYWRCKRPDGSRRCFFAPPPAT